MKIKQQKQIKAFLIQAFGPDRGGALFAGQEEILTALVEQVNDPSERRRETLIQTILPQNLYKPGAARQPFKRSVRPKLIRRGSVAPPKN